VTKVTNVTARPLAARTWCCHVANGFTNFSGDGRTNRQTMIAIAEKSATFVCSTDSGTEWLTESNASNVECWKTVTELHPIRADKRKAGNVQTTSDIGLSRVYEMTANVSELILPVRMVHNT